MISTNKEVTNHTKTDKEIPCFVLKGFALKTTTGGVKMKTIAFVSVLFSFAVLSSICHAEEWIPIENGYLYDKSSITKLGDMLQVKMKDAARTYSMTFDCQKATYSDSFTGKTYPVFNSIFKDFAIQSCKK